MIKELIKLANNLDSRGLIGEANYLDQILKRLISKTAGSMGDEYLIKDPNKTLTVNDAEGNTHTIKLDGIDTGWYGDSSRGGLEYSINNEKHEWKFLHSGYYIMGAVINIIENIKGINNNAEEPTEVESQIAAFLVEQIEKNPNYKWEDTE